MFWMCLLAASVGTVSSLCDAGHYGPNCTGVCVDRHCAYLSSCSSSDGRCSDGCQPGWAGTDCTECHNTRYGRKCLKLCADRYCSGKSACDQVTGFCDNGCEPGWGGTDCSEDCDRDHYGPNCTGVCADRHCTDMSSCSPSDGKCKEGCQSGWTGIDCTEETPETTDGLLLMLTMPLVIVTVAFTIFTGFLMFVRQRRLMIIAQRRNLITRATHAVNNAEKKHYVNKDSKGDTTPGACRQNITDLRTPDNLAANNQDVKEDEIFKNV